MATPYRSEYSTVDEVLNFYDGADGTNYKVFAGSNNTKPEYLRYSYNGTDKEVGMQKLHEALIALKQNIENTNPYTIQVAKKYKLSKEGQETAINPVQIAFQLNKPDRYMPYGAVGMVQQTDNDLKLILSKIVEGQNLLISKLSEEEFEEEEEEKKENSFLSGILNNPEFQSMAINAISGLIGKGLTGTPQPTALAGIPDEQKEKALIAINLISKRDEKFGDHLLYLANIDDAKYNMLLSLMN